MTNSKPLLSTGYSGRESLIPNGSSRFIVPVTLRQALRGHILSRDLLLGSAGFTRAAKRYAPPLTSAYMIYYCTSGNMVLQTESGNQPVASGDLVVIPPFRVHRANDSETAPCSYFWVSYTGDLSANYTQFINASDVVVHVGLHPELIAQFEALCKFRTSNFTLDACINVSHRLRLLLTSISLTLSEKTNRSKGRIDLDRIRNFMARRLDSSLNLQELAEYVNLSSYHFARTFKNLTGQSPMRYFTQMRLQQACHLLDTTAQPISTIASTVGYSDPHYFSRIFRQTIGMAPHAYRNWATPASTQEDDSL